MFPHLLLQTPGRKTYFLHSVFALCGQSGIESKDWTLYSS